jgi:hypothetical protein
MPGIGIERDQFVADVGGQKVDGSFVKRLIHAPSSSIEISPGHIWLRTAIEHGEPPVVEVM